MIRVNLLPRRRRTITALGIELDVDHARQIVVGIAIVTAVVLLGAGVESVRSHRIGTAADAIETYLASVAPKRERARGLALEVARLQEIAREEERVRRSGAIAAAELARIGNAIPNRVWLDALVHNADGFEVSGDARSVDGIGGTILALGNAFPTRNATLVTIENRGEGDALAHFAAHLGDDAAASSDPGPTP